MGCGVAVTTEMAKMAKNIPKVSLISVMAHFVSLLVLNWPPGEYFKVQSAKKLVKTGSNEAFCAEMTIL